MQRSFPAFAACLPGLEPLLHRELAGLGVAGTQLQGGVAFHAEVPLLLRCGHWLGTASHVLLRLAEFPCRALGELERKAAGLPWEQWLRPDVALQVRATTRKSRVYHTGAVEERVGNAVARAFGRALPVARQDGELPTANLAVRFHADVCTISLDATSTPLHRRGYRLAGAKAPLREDLAHALLLAAQYQPGEALCDPFCGSGTIAIEAAGLLLGLPPGRLRPPPLQHLALFDASAWRSVAAERRTVPPPAPIAASDRDAGAVAAARANAERAGVATAITFTTAAFTAQPWLAEPGSAPKSGLLACNPPFGHRIGKGQDLRPLYQTLGNRTAELGPGWRVALLAHDPRLARRTGLRLSVQCSTRHGGLPVTVLVGQLGTDTATPSDGA